MDNERLTTKERLLEVWPLLASAREFAARDGRQTLSTLDLMLAAVERSDLRENVEMFFDVYLDTDFILSRIERVSHVGRLTGALEPEFVDEFNLHATRELADVLSEYLATVDKSVHFFPPDTLVACLLKSTGTLVHAFMDHIGVDRHRALQRAIETEKLFEDDPDLDIMDENADIDSAVVEFFTIVDFEHYADTLHPGIGAVRRAPGSPIPYDELWALERKGAHKIVEREIRERFCKSIMVPTNPGAAVRYHVDDGIERWAVLGSAGEWYCLVDFDPVPTELIERSSPEYYAPRVTCRNEPDLRPPSNR